MVQRKLRWIKFNKLMKLAREFHFAEPKHKEFFEILECIEKTSPHDLRRYASLFEKIYFITIQNHLKTLKILFINFHFSFAGISMHKGYAFVQFTNPFDARNACHGEDGRTVLSQVLGKWRTRNCFHRFSVYLLFGSFKH